MSAFRALVFAAVLAGLAAGAATSVVQALRLWPLIEAAEVIEAQGGGHGHDALGWTPEGALRPALTVLFNIAAGIGFALMLNAAARLRGGGGLTVHDGIAWGVAGFAAFALAPALGLPPVLPGMEAGPLLARQGWWLATAAATSGGIAMLAWLGGPRRWAGAALIVLPHLAGAPQHGHSAVPGELAAGFAAASLAASAVFWVVLGAVSGWAQQRLAAAR